MGKPTHAQRMDFVMDTMGWAQGDIILEKEKC